MSMTDIAHVNDWRYPPYPYLENLAYHCPKTISTYLWLWANKDKNHKVTLDQNEIPRRTQHSKSAFKNNLMWLVRERLINVTTKNNLCHIELVAWDD